MANWLDHRRGAHDVLISSMSEIGYKFTAAKAGEALQHAVPLYVVPKTAATRQRPLQHLEFRALWFPILIEGVPALARVNSSHDDYAFGGVSYGTLPALVHRSLIFAAERVGDHRRLYQMAFISSLPLQILLLVLRPASGRTLYLILQNQIWSAPAEFRLETGLAGFFAEVHRRTSTPRDPQA